MLRRTLDYTFVNKLSDAEFIALLDTNPILSRNFKLNEFLKSQIASRHGIPNIPNREQFLNLSNLCKYVLQPIRIYYGRPIDISSGFRSEELNEAIRGSENSQHCKGQAADFEIIGIDNYVVALRLSQMPKLQYDQIILEYHVPHIENSGWIHISYNNDRDRQRRETLTINSKGTRYGIIND